MGERRDRLSERWTDGREEGTDCQRGGLMGERRGRTVREVD